MNKLESTIPFCGFYESFISDDIDHQIGQQIEWDSDIYDLNKNEQQILCDNYFSYRQVNPIKRIYDLSRRKEENVKLNNNDLFGEDILGYSI